MKHHILRILAALPGVPMLINGMGFIFSPDDTARSLGMPLLDGIARSTQLGDFTSFFLSCSLFIFLGAYWSSARWLYAGALILGLAATMRCVAYLVNGAELASTFIAAEVILTIWLVVVAQFMGRSNAERTAGEG